MRCITQATSFAPQRTGHDESEDHMMGMITNQVQVYVLPKTGPGIFFGYALADEICAELTRDETLFADVPTTGQLLERLGYGFRDYWANEDTDGRVNFLDVLFEMYRTDEACDGSSGNATYDAFSSRVAALALSDIRAVVLMTDEQLESRDRTFSWIRYDLMGGKATTGTGTGVYTGTGRYNPAACSPSAEVYIAAVAEGD